MAEAIKNKKGGTVVYRGGGYITFSELFDRKPEHDELANVVRKLEPAGTIRVLCQMSGFLRQAFEEGEERIAKVQEFLVSNFIDDSTFRRLQERFSDKGPQDRPIFHPLQILNLLRLVAVESTGPEAENPTDNKDARYQLGTAALMMNDLLVSAREELDITEGDEESRRIHLMVQLFPLWEVMNPVHPMHLLARSHVLYRILLVDPRVSQKIFRECNEFDLAGEFEKQTGISIGKWLSLSFACYSYFLQATDIADQKPEFLAFTSDHVVEKSGVTEEEFQKFVGGVSAHLEELRQTMQAQAERPADPRFDLVPLRSKPLLRIGNQYHCVDLALLIEKLHTGVHWLIHDALPRSRRQDLFKAWGMLFQEYVDWLLKGIDWGPEVIYRPSPRFDDRDEEAFDGLLLKASTLFALEYKGGFVSQAARYSLEKIKMIAELERKFVKEGCGQLVSTLTKLFGTSSNPQRLKDVPVDRVERIIPVLIVQDHILRGPFVNWWLNRRFQECLSANPLRDGVQVLPLTVVNVHELESMVQSAEASSFDILYALHHRTVRDPEMLSILKDFVMQFGGFGTKEESERWGAIRTAIQDEMFSYLFPEEWMKEKHAN